MKAILLVASILALAAMPSVAQQAAKANSPAASHFVPTGECPAHLTAHQQGSGQAVWTIALEDAGKPAQSGDGPPPETGVHVNLQLPRGAELSHVRLMVSFVPPGVRAYPVPAARFTSTRPAEQKKTFELSAPDGTDREVEGDLLVGRSFLIKRVHLLELTYADGRVWRAPREDACSIEPNRFLLIHQP